MRLAVLVGCVALSLSTPAQAATRSTTDANAGVGFQLRGKNLVVSLLAPSAPVQPGSGRRVTRPQVEGKRIDAICASSFRRGGVRVIASRRWPAGASAVRFAFPRDISREARLCLLEDGGSDLALASFPGRLSVSSSFDPSGGLPIEGSLTYLQLRGARGRPLFRRQADRLNEPLPPGRYRLSSYQRTCSGHCGQLDAPGTRCSRVIRIPAARTVRLGLSISFSGGCVFMKQTDLRWVRAAARRAAAQRARRFGFVIAPALWRVRCRLGAHAWSCRARSAGGQCQGKLEIRGKPRRLRVKQTAIRCED